MDLEFCSRHVCLILLALELHCIAHDAFFHAFLGQALPSDQFCRFLFLLYLFSIT